MKILFKIFGHTLNLLSIVAPKLCGKWGMFLFCYPIKIKMQQFHLKFLASATPVDFTFQNKKVAAYKWGNGHKNVLFVHGWNSYTFRWKKYIEALVAKGYTVYSIDAPGNGMSEGHQLNIKVYAECIQLLCQQIGTVDTLVAHSFGGFASIYAGYMYPNQQAEKYVIMGSAENASNFFLFYKQMLGLSQKAVDTIVNRFVQVLGEKPEFYQAGNFAKAMTKPCLIIHDEKDPETPYEGALAIHRNWKNAQMHTTKNAGHQLKTPEVLQLVTNYVLKGEHVSA